MSRTAGQYQATIDSLMEENKAQAEQITKWKDAFEEMSECYGNAVTKDFKQAEQITTQDKEIRDNEEFIAKHFPDPFKTGEQPTYQELEQENKRLKVIARATEAKASHRFEIDTDIIKRLNTEIKRLNRERDILYGSALGHIPQAEIESMLAAQPQGGE